MGRKRLRQSQNSLAWYSGPFILGPPQEVAQHFGISPSTVRQWIKGGWLGADTILSARPHPQRRVHRYYIPRSTLTLFEQDTHTMFSDLQKYIPREKARQRRKAEKKQYQPSLPLMEDL